MDSSNLTEYTFDRLAINYDNFEYSSSKILLKNVLNIVNYRVINTKSIGSLKLLDIGCGTGEFLKRIKNTHLDLYGADISKNMCSVAKCKLKKNAQIFHINFLYSDKTFKEGFFDIIICMETLHHVPDITKFFEVINYISKETTFIVIGDIYYKKLERFWRNLFLPDDFGNYKYYSIKDLLVNNNILIEKYAILNGDRYICVLKKV